MIILLGVSALLHSFANFGRELACAICKCVQCAGAFLRGGEKNKINSLKFALTYLQ